MVNWGTGLFYPVYNIDMSWAGSSKISSFLKFFLKTQRILFSKIWYQKHEIWIKILGYILRFVSNQKNTDSIPSFFKYYFLLKLWINFNVSIVFHTTFKCRSIHFIPSFSSFAPLLTKTYSKNVVVALAALQKQGNWQSWNHIVFFLIFTNFFSNV